MIILCYKEKISMGTFVENGSWFLNVLKQHSCFHAAKNEEKNLREKMCLNVLEEVQNNLVCTSYNYEILKGECTTKNDNSFLLVCNLNEMLAKMVGYCCCCCCTVGFACMDISVNNIASSFQQDKTKF